MPIPQLTPDSARLISVAALGLLQPPPRPAEKGDLLAVIRGLGALQIDTISVVARSPYFVLFSRLGNYQPAWLDEHLAEGSLFEYWAHAACFLPREDYALHRRVMLDGGAAWFSEEWYAENAAVVNGVLAHIRDNGPARSADFERSDGKKGSWWDWKVEKKALEYWFGKGELMVARRVGFQRVYDLRERIRPDWDDRLAPNREETERQLTLKAVRALGLAKIGWIADYYRQSKRDTLARVRALELSGALIRVAVEGWSEPGYAHPDQTQLLEAAAAGELQPSHTTLLSPFDPLIWHRERMRDLFGFEFTIQCYTPAAKRTGGYFPLPILHRGRLIGRLDAKAHRKERIFEVRSLSLEPGVVVTEQLGSELARTLRDCAVWHATPQLQISACDSPDLLACLRQ